MEIEFENTKEDFKSYYKSHYINEFKKRILYTLPSPLLIGFLVAGQPFDLPRFIYTTLILFVLFIGIFYLLPYFISVYKLRKLIQTEPEYIGSKKLSITEEGLKFESTDKNGIWHWDSIISIDNNTRFIFLLMADNRFSLIPKNAFKTDNELINFIGSVQSEIARSGEPSKTLLNSVSKKPPYLLGILCLIPLIGAFVGLVFIILGISRFKDKWFTLIGVLGIAFTVSIYSSLFYAVEHTSIFKESEKLMSKTFLNELVKEIEFHHLENGQYPDSLQELIKKDKFISIYDPLQSKGLKSSVFGYERRENYYNLYSVGKDGIPNTKDDFYPKISKKLIGKIGVLNYELETDELKKE